MARTLRDIFLAVAVLLALPIGMLGPALTLPALIYGFPVVMAAILGGLLLLLLGGGRSGRTAAVGTAGADAESRRAPAGTVSSRPAPLRSVQRPYSVVARRAASPASPPASAVLVSLEARGNGSAGPAFLAPAEPLAGGPFRRLLVLLDPEDFAPRALARAIATARRDGAELILAGVLEIEEARRRPSARANLAHHPATLRAQLDKELENICWQLQAAGVNVRRRAEIGDPKRRLPEMAGEERVDAVIVAPPRPGLLGLRSMPPDWAAHSPCPVLTPGI